ncbi:DUF2691 family protein [Paenibacillus aestuarii]|uniref:DUF2691 family protein n=1 Tax=Paenibacillus aestuarii TaxID=516965 RepID=UPI0038CD8A69
MKPFERKKYNWLVGAGEEYKWQDTDLKPIFPDNVNILNGEELLQFINTDVSQYIIFTDLKAFPIGSHILKIDKYEEFIKSDCELILLSVDSSYTSIYCKDPKLLSELYVNMESLKVDKLSYITDENDFRSTVIVR